MRWFPERSFLFREASPVPMESRKKDRGEKKAYESFVGSALQEPATESCARRQLASPWRVVVWNDPVNLADYVVLVFRRIFGYSETKARGLMEKIHTAGSAAVWVGDRELAEMYVHRIHSCQLRATLERDQ